MTDYRVEATADTASGLFYVEVFYPGDANVPVAKTRPVYASLAEAKYRVEDAIGPVFGAPASPLFGKVSDEA